MVLSKAALLAFAMGLFATANAHMVLNTPIPFGKSTLNNSPLDNSGSDFPCKQRPGVYDITTKNEITVGAPQRLSFTGGATHGGGSCQVSITLDKNPSKASQWKVVRSIIGGCPHNGDGNLSGDPNDDQSSDFTFTLPAGMPNGEYTLAWTWFNKIGNREMYMNCAPIVVSGGKDNDNTVFNSLPDMFVANLPREDCNTPDSQNIVFPNPGQDVETKASGAFATALEGPRCAAVTAIGRGSGSAGTPAQPTSQPSASANPPAVSSAPASQQTASSAPASQPTASSAPASQPTVSSAPANPPSAPSFRRPGEFAPSASSAASVSPTATSLITVTSFKSQPAASTTTPVASSIAAPQPTGEAPSGSCQQGEMPCTASGNICNGTLLWGACSNGCVRWSNVPAGTNCENGGLVHAPQAAKRDFLRRQRRGLRHAHADSF